MDTELLKILSEELRETKNIVAETRKLADAAQKTAEAAQKTAEAAMKQANASWTKAESSWELVVMTRNKIQEDLEKIKLPWWRKLLRNAA